jgi:hypothetical protein
MSRRRLKPSPLIHSRVASAALSKTCIRASAGATACHASLLLRRRIQGHNQRRVHCCCRRHVMPQLRHWTGLLALPYPHPIRQFQYFPVVYRTQPHSEDRESNSCKRYVLKTDKRILA